VPEYITEVAEPPVDEEIEVPEYITEVAEPPVDEEIEVPEYIQHMPTMEDMPVMKDMQDIEEIEILDNGNGDTNNYGNNDLNNDNWDNNNYDNNNNLNKAIPKSRMERVLQEAYLSKKNNIEPNQDLRGEQLSKERQLNEQRTQRENITQEEKPEEISYLEEIEERLKDIQARLKGSDALEENIRRFEQQNLLNRKDDDKVAREKGISSPIQELIDKIAEFNTTASINETYEHTLKIDNKLRALYTNASKVQPFAYSSDKIDWVQIALSDIDAIPTLSRKWATQPFVTFSYYKYNEIILGKEKTAEQYYIGIPDIYHPERRNILQGDAQIERFACRKDVEPTIGEYGYWLVKI